MRARSGTGWATALVVNPATPARLSPSNPLMRVASALLILAQQVLAQLKDAVLACLGGMTGCGSL